MVRNVNHDAFAGAAFRLAGRAAGNAKLADLAPEIERMLHLYTIAVQREGIADTEEQQGFTASPDHAPSPIAASSAAPATGKRRRRSSRSVDVAPVATPFQPYIPAERVQ